MVPVTGLLVCPQVMEQWEAAYLLETDLGFEKVRVSVNS